MCIADDFPTIAQLAAEIEAIVKRIIDTVVDVAKSIISSISGQLPRPDHSPVFRLIPSPRPQRLPWYTSGFV